MDKDGQRRDDQGSSQEDGAGRPGRWHRPHHDSVPATDEAQQGGLRPAALRETLGGGAAGVFSHLKGELFWTKWMGRIIVTIVWCWGHHYSVNCQYDEQFLNWHTRTFLDQKLEENCLDN